MSIYNTDDIIDSRDIIDRIEELASLVDETGEGEHIAEWKALTALAKQCENESSDWAYGATLIARSYFVEYVQDLLADIGDIPRNLPHYIEIDWEATARNIEADYVSIDFDGVEYLIRSC